MRGVAPKYQRRLELEDVLALHIRADKHLWVALTRLVQAAKTQNDREIIDELLEAREVIAKSHEKIVAMHPDRAEKE